jgi:hypothetical protein
MSINVWNGKCVAKTKKKNNKIQAHFHHVDIKAQTLEEKCEHYEVRVNKERW